MSDTTSNKPDCESAAESKLVKEAVSKLTEKLNQVVAEDNPNPRNVEEEFLDAVDAVRAAYEGEGVAPDSPTARVDADFPHPMVLVMRLTIEAAGRRRYITPSMVAAFVESPAKEHISVLLDKNEPGLIVSALVVLLKWKYPGKVDHEYEPYFGDATLKLTLTGGETTSS